MTTYKKPGYRADYKTSDPNWWTPPNEALKGKGSMTVRFKKLHEAAKVPEFKTADAAGMDLSAVGFHVVPARGKCVVSTGLAMALPSDYEAQIRPRSGLAAKHGVTVLNTPGTIDADYRGELKVILVNHSPEDFQIETGDRIAQMVLKKVERLRVLEVEELDDTERGDGGLGSTGVK